MSAPTRASAAKRRPLSPHSAPPGAGIGAAVANVKMRRVEHEKVETRGSPQEHARRGAHQITERMHRLRRLQSGQHCRIPGQQGPHLDAMLAQCLGQRPGHVGKPAGLDERIHL